MKILRILSTPSCWIRNHSTSKSLDTWLIDALKKPKFSNIGEHTVCLNGKILWVNNYPYCYGYLYQHQSIGIPSRSTVFALYDALTKYILEAKA